MTHLRVLDLTNNSLSTLPDWLAELGLLCEICVNGNPLRVIPRSLAGLPHFTGLHVSRCPGIGEDDGIGALPHLRTLMMEQTGLSQVPEWLRGLRGLTNLSLGSNALRELPEWIGALNQLEGLWLEQNRLRSLPLSLRNLPRLRVLQIDGNPDLHIPAHIAASMDPDMILDTYFRSHSLPANI